MDDILVCNHVYAGYGRISVLNDLSLQVKGGQILGIIGPNGSGKTTLLNALSGMILPTAGTILYQGKDITRLTPDARCRMGIARTFQVPRAFEHMSVYENILASVVYGQRVSEKEARKKALEILELVKLDDRANEPAGKLRLINRKRLEIGAALASDPKLLLLDEVAGGLTSAEVAEILDIVKTIKAKGVSIIWIEHIIKTLMEGTDRIMLMAGGKDLITDTPQEVMKSSIVNEVYMGADEDD